MIPHSLTILIQSWFADFVELMESGVRFLHHLRYRASLAVIGTPPTINTRTGYIPVAVHVPHDFCGMCLDMSFTIQVGPMTPMSATKYVSANVSRISPVLPTRGRWCRHRIRSWTDK
jgi:hypothetical protein